MSIARLNASLYRDDFIKNMDEQGLENWDVLSEYTKKKIAYDIMLKIYQGYSISSIEKYAETLF